LAGNPKHVLFYQHFRTAFESHRKSTNPYYFVCRLLADGARVDRMSKQEGALQTRLPRGPWLEAPYFLIVRPGKR
jgi:hypothetical protein